MAGAQAGRTERVTATVTPYEKQAVRVVALLRETDASNLLRDMTIAEIVGAYEAAKASGKVA